MTNKTNNIILKKNNNTLANIRPDLLEQWDWNKNIGLDAENITAGSHKKVWWIGLCGHNWEAVVKDRVRGNNCPICAGKVVLEGFNDLQSQNPKIANEWNWSRNGDLRPSTVTEKSHKKVWWKCEKNHEYQMTIDSRARGRGCPYCASKYVINGETDLFSKNSFLASEWMELKNKRTSKEVFANSHEHAWWKCTICGNEWRATPSSRMAGNGCPKCSKRLHTSFPEQAIFFYLKLKYPNAINGYRDVFEGEMELDIYIPELKIGIEYDGAHWHSSETEINRAIEKYKRCQTNGIYLIRIKENINEILDADKVIPAKKTVEEIMISLKEIVEVPDDINIDRDRADIYANYVSILKCNSIASKYPQYISEWHPTKNGDLTPEMFAAKSDKKVWWKCKNNHDYHKSIAKVTSGSGCPYCAHRKLLRGYNDFATTHKDSELLKEWDYDKNNILEVYTDSVMAGSKKKVFWKCPNGHSWQSAIGTRTAENGRGCPICTSNLIQQGVNDLTTLNPLLAEQWNYNRNGILKPEMFTINSNRKVWWKCSLGHEWEAYIERRSQGTGCPVCSNRIVLEGFNDLATTNPLLAMQWNYKKNDNIFPTMVTQGSDKKVWWKCPLGHEWQAAIKDRNKGSGCPYCRKSK